MKQLWRNIALGMLLGMPGAIYANVLPNDTSSPYPSCCYKCDKAATCTACKQDCQAECLQPEPCYEACDSHAPNYPCSDPVATVSQ